MLARVPGEDSERSKRSSVIVGPIENYQILSPKAVKTSEGVVSVTFLFLSFLSYPSDLVLLLV